ncbi:MAG: ClC family H(+)/Cl(-) exchange transporter [Termitinemataceae bacterium]|nr:MAG: ClC family H(+)/Cl(-) exchange transporter [Termitinemataceae bacterium]
MRKLKHKKNIYHDSQIKVKIETVINDVYKSRLAIIIESMAIGCVIGFVIVLFRSLIIILDRYRFNLYKNFFSFTNADMLRYGLALLAIALALGIVNILRPMVAGGGVPQIKGAINGQLRTHWQTELPLKFIASLAAIGCGFSFGWEGPSLMIAAYAGFAVLSIFKREGIERKTLLTSSTAAGVSAAFSAPLAGVIYVLEEMHASMAPLSIACAMGASMTADAVAGYFFGFMPIYNFRAIRYLPVHYLPWVIVLGILCGLFGGLFKKTLYAGTKLFDVCKIPVVLRPVIPMIVVVPLSIYMYDVTGGGHELINSLTVSSKPISVLIMLFIVKLLFSGLCFGSGTSGGIFLPFLAYGALLGDLFGKVLSLAGYASIDQQLNYMILGMAGMFASVVKAPVSAIVLVMEMSGNYNHFASLVLVCLCSFVTAELIKSRSVYDVLLEKILEKKDKRICIEQHDPKNKLSKIKKMLIKRYSNLSRSLIKQNTPHADDIKSCGTNNVSNQDDNE